MTALQPIDIFLMCPDQTVGAGLPAMAVSQPTGIPLMYPAQTVGAELARDGGLIGGEIFAGVHIHSCGYGFYWFRFYSESLGKAPSNQGLLPLSCGASPGLGILSLPAPWARRDRPSMAVRG